MLELSKAQQVANALGERIEKAPAGGIFHDAVVFPCSPMAGVSRFTLEVPQGNLGVAGSERFKAQPQRFEITIRPY